MKQVSIHGKQFTVEHDHSFWEHIDEWEPQTFAIIERFSGKGKTMIDVGAYNGVLSLYASTMYREVHSFEPDSLAYSRLKNNVEHNGISNVICVNAAASTENGETDLYMKNPGDSISSMLDRTMPGYETRITEKVKTIRLSEYATNINDVGLIKIDIEGGEIYVIPELSNYLLHNYPSLYVSFHPNWFPEREKSISTILDTLLPIYTAYTVNFEECDRNYIERALDSTEHSFIFCVK